MKIALLSQQVRHYSGGRYYAYSIAVALSELGHDVTVYVDSAIPFARDFRLYRQPRVVKTPLYAGTGIPRHDLFIGLPMLGASAACRLGQRYRVPSVVCVLDVLPLMRRYRDDDSAAMMDVFWGGMLDDIKTSKSFVFVLADWNRRPAANWLNIPLSRVLTMYPAVNDRVIDSLGIQSRKYRACFISRLEPHKKLPHAIDALKPFGLHLDIVTARADPALIDSRDMRGYATFHIGVDDVSKFLILLQSRLLIFPSVWEGFGVPVVEALASRTPVVCYSFPTFKEVVANTEMAKYVYFAKYEDRASLQANVVRCIRDGYSGRFDPDRRFGMNQMMRRLALALQYIGRIEEVS